MIYGILITYSVIWLVGIIIRESGIISDTNDSMILMASHIVGLILILIFLQLTLDSISDKWYTVFS